MVYGMIGPMISHYKPIQMQIGLKIQMIGKVLVEEHSFLEEDWFLG
jgi:hypothetical protein